MRNAALLVLCLLAADVDAQPGVDVRFVDQQLTVHAHGVPLRALVERIGELASIAIVNRERLDGVASADFDHQSIAAALKTLLADFNYVLTGTAGRDASQTARLVLRVHSRVGGTVAGHIPITLPALEAFHASQLEEHAQEKSGVS